MSDIRHDDSRRPLRRQAAGRSLRAHILRPVLAGFAVLAMTLPGEATIVRSGTVVASFTVDFAAAPPAGSKVFCAVALLGSDPLAPSETKSATVNVTGSGATCRVTLPYRWRLQTTNSKMAINYSVAGPLQTSQGIYATVPVPATGTTTNVAVVINH